MMMMINVKIWDRVARLMDHLEERRAEDKYVKCQINRSEHFDTHNMVRSLGFALDVKIS